MKNKSKVLISALLILIIFGVAFGYRFYQENKGTIRTSGIKLKYRVYTEVGGWSKWFNNNQVAGTEGHKILAIEIKTDTKSTGHIFYNTYSDNLTFNDNDEYDGLTSGDKKYPLYGIKIFLTDDMYKNYKVYYRTHNELDSWLGWSSNKEISGDLNKGMDLIQIKILKSNEEFKYEPNKSHRNFTEANYE